jgi:hypothetical protein
LTRATACGRGIGAFSRGRMATWRGASPRRRCGPGPGRRAPESERDADLEKGTATVASRRVASSAGCPLTGGENRRRGERASSVVAYDGRLHGAFYQGIACMAWQATTKCTSRPASQANLTRSPDSRVRAMMRIRKARATRLSPA